MSALPMGYSFLENDTNGIGVFACEKCDIEQEYLYNPTIGGAYVECIECDEVTTLIERIK